MASDASQSAKVKSKDQPEAKPAKMGRPSADINIDQLKAFMANYPTEESTALFFGTSSRTIRKRIRDEFDMTYLQFREKHMLHTRHNLIQKALHRALVQSSDRMLEMCLRNLNDWDKNRDIQNEPQQIIQLQYSLDKAPDLKDVTPKAEDSTPQDEAI